MSASAWPRFAGRQPFSRDGVPRVTTWPRATDPGNRGALGSGGIIGGPSWQCTPTQ